MLHNSSGSNNKNERAAREEERAEREKAWVLAYIFKLLSRKIEERTPRKINGQIDYDARNARQIEKECKDYYVIKSLILVALCEIKLNKKIDLESCTYEGKSAAQLLLESAYYITADGLKMPEVATDNTQYFTENANLDNAAIFTLLQPDTILNYMRNSKLSIYSINTVFSILSSLRLRGAITIPALIPVIIATSLGIGYKIYDIVQKFKIQSSVEKAERLNGWLNGASKKEKLTLQTRLNNSLKPLDDLTEHFDDIFKPQKDYFKILSPITRPIKSIGKSIFGFSDIIFSPFEALILREPERLITSSFKGLMRITSAVIELALTPVEFIVKGVYLNVVSSITNETLASETVEEKIINLKKSSFTEESNGKSKGFLLKNDAEHSAVFLELKSLNQSYKKFLAELQENDRLTSRSIRDLKNNRKKLWRQTKSEFYISEKGTETEVMQARKKSFELFFNYVENPHMVLNSPPHPVPLKDRRIILI